MNFKNKQQIINNRVVYIYICKERTKVIKTTTRARERESKNPTHNINNISINMITTNELDP